MAQVPIRELIIEALAQKVGARRADRELENEDLPARALWDGEDADVQRTEYGEVSVTTGLSLIAQHLANQDHTTWSTQGNEIMAQMIADATGGDTTLGDLCDDIAYTATAILYPDAGSTIITVGVDLAVRWRHPIGNPFTEQP